MWSRYPLGANDGADDDAVPGLAPAEDRGAAQFLEVDGERFALFADGRGGTHYDWLSGPNADYGFSASPAVGLSADEHRDNIRTFLAQIDPATGYIADD